MVTGVRVLPETVAEPVPSVTDQVISPPLPPLDVHVSGVPIVAVFALVIESAVPGSVQSVDCCEPL